MTMDATLQYIGGAWVLTLARDFAHPVEVVWPWLTDPARLARWSPIVPDMALDGVGPKLLGYRATLKHSGVILTERSGGGTVVAAAFSDRTTCD